MNESLPMPVKATPYRHQQEAFRFICDKFGIIDGVKKSSGAGLLMDMGCGKSLTAIAGAGILFQYGLIDKVLVVAPLSLLGMWREEFQRFADFGVDITVLSGTLAKKKQQITEAINKSKSEDAPLTVVVVNYESAWRLEKELLAYGAGLVIADEGHKLKENRTSQSKGMHHLADRADFRLLLTGTVITNREIDVYSQYRFLNPLIFGTSFYRFRKRYFEMTGYGQHTPVFRESRRDEFLRKMHSIAFRVTKEEALDLPGITEEIRIVDLEPKAMKLYREIEKESYAELAESEVTAANILTRILRLSQVTGGFLSDDEKHTHSVSTAKLNALFDVVDTAMNENRKLVIMARFVAEMEAIQAELERRKISYAQVRGGVKDRAEEVRRFQEDADCRVFIGQIAAAGLGLTLTAASTMVFYSMDYSMSNFTQAQARIHRIGTKNTCHYIYLVADRTVDRKVLDTLRNKIDLAKLLVDDYRKGNNPFSDSDTPAVKS